MKDIDVEWCVAKPFNGIIEIIDGGGKVICSLALEDYEDEEAAVLMAGIIASLLKVLTPVLLLSLINS